jgi:hypothetical protein
MTNVECLHFHHSITASADNFICYKINTVYFVRVTRKIRLDFVRFEVPNLRDDHRSDRYPLVPRRTLTVVSLLALTRSRESADHVSL